MLPWSHIGKDYRTHEPFSKLETGGFEFSIRCQRVWPSGRRKYVLWGGIKTTPPYQIKYTTMESFFASNIYEAEIHAEKILKSKYLNADIKILCE